MVGIEKDVCEHCRPQISPLCTKESQNVCPFVTKSKAFGESIELGNLIQEGFNQGLKNGGEHIEPIRCNNTECKHPKILAEKDEEGNIYILCNGCKEKMKVELKGVELMKITEQNGVLTATQNIIAKIVDDTKKKTDEYMLDEIVNHIFENGEEYKVINISKSKIKEIFILGLEEYQKLKM